jgi:molybdenum cofactor cytidylyltransferase
MAMKLGDKTLVEHSVLSMYDVVDRVIVVGGYGIERVRDILGGYPKVEVIYNQDFRRGMFSSVQAGLRHLRSLYQDASVRARVFLLPGDYPLVRQDTYRRMLMVSGHVVIPTCKGRRGHPVLMSTRLIEHVLCSPDTYNLRDCIKRFGYAGVEVEDEGILCDVDTMEDYESVKRLYDKHN